MEFKHVPVLLKETIEGLNIKPDGIYVDGTIGGAGHSKEIIKRLSPNGLLIGIDRDEEALKAAKENLKEYNNCRLVHGNHDDIKEILNDLGIQKVDGILLAIALANLSSPYSNIIFANSSSLYLVTTSKADNS